MKPINSVHAVLICAIILSFFGCQPNSYLLEPKIALEPNKCVMERLPSSFTPLTQEELKQDWGKEIKIADSFAREFDLYRAITSYRRAEILLPKEELQRRQQIQYDIIFCYYLGGKYAEAIETFESSCLTEAAPPFPGFQNLLLILYDSYQKLGSEEKAEAIHQLIEKYSPNTAEDLSLSQAILNADLPKIACFSEKERYDYCGCFLENYHTQALSVRRAQTLNALLPGAGYYYVGQKKSAITSFLLNALFIAAAYQFFDHGYNAAAIFTTSLELGWYIGGINGAGLAAKQYNENLYYTHGKHLLTSHRLAPAFMFQFAF
jgi:hypothetical protein